MCICVSRQQQELQPEHVCIHRGEICLHAHAEEHECGCRRTLDAWDRQRHYNQWALEALGNTSEVSFVKKTLAVHAIIGHVTFADMAALVTLLASFTSLRQVVYGTLEHHLHCLDLEGLRQAWCSVQGSVCRRDNCCKQGTRSGRPGRLSPGLNWERLRPSDDLNFTSNSWSIAPGPQDRCKRKPQSVAISI